MRMTHRDLRRGKCNPGRGSRLAHEAAVYVASPELRRPDYEGCRWLAATWLAATGGVA